MTISEQIRAAALGPRPRFSDWIYCWLGDYREAYKAVLRLSDYEKFTGSSETIKRMFLLLCAEALESETA